jgi:hypothetical protein
MSTEDVFAVPLPPTNNTALLLIDVFGAFNMKFKSNSARNESMVGINNCEN